jgi:thymidylate synthase
MAKLIEGDVLEEVWLQILRLILDEGQELKDQRNSITKEILNFVWVVNDPLNSNIPKRYPLKLGMAEYEDQFLDKELHGHPYTYGNRLRDFMLFLPKKGEMEKDKDLNDMEFVMAFVDQINRLRVILKQNRNTRRATAVTWKLPEDLASEEVPC